MQVEECTPITHFWRCSLCNELSWIDYRNLQKIIEILGTFGKSKRRREDKNQQSFSQLVLVWQKYVLVVLAVLLGLAVVRNHLFGKRKNSS